MIDLKVFVEKEMRMTAIYQPMIIMALLKSKTCSATMDSIGKAISMRLTGTEEKANYYAHKLTVYPKQVLYKHGIAVTGVTKETSKTYYLTDVLQELAPKQKRAIIKDCEKRVTEYIAKKAEKAIKAFIEGK